MQIVCFEDHLVSRLSPITLARPAYAITCGSFRLVDWLSRIADTVHGVTRGYLQMLGKYDHGVTPLTASTIDDEGMLIVNARLAPTVELGRLLQSLLRAGAAGVIRDPVDECVLVAILDAGAVAEAKTQIHERKRDPLTALTEVATRLLPIEQPAPASLRLPHDVVAQHMAAMDQSLQHRIENGRYREVQDGLFVGENVSIGDHEVVNATDGPIVLDDGVSVGPFCYLAGPVYAGKKSKIIEHSALKDAVALGHTVKIGGEVEASVIEPYSNKQHHGFLGHSYLGSWINLGAGTCNSDLKNTYGAINMDYGDGRAATGMQFLGCFIGDYSKTAINTSIFTGKIIGVCSMLYGFVTSNVPSFVNYARLFGQTSLLPADVIIKTQERMFARRGVEQRQCDRQLIHDMYDLTAAERSSDSEML